MMSLLTLFGGLKNVFKVRPVFKNYNYILTKTLFR